MKHCIIVLLLIAFVSLTAVRISAGLKERSADDQQKSKAAGEHSFLTDPFIQLQGEYYSNSSDFTRQSTGAGFGFIVDGGIKIRAGYAYSDFFQKGFETVSRNRLFIQGEKQVSKETGIEVSASGNSYDNGNDNFNGGLSIRYHPWTGLFTEISFRHFDIIDYVPPFNNAIYSYVVTIGSVDLNIHSDDYKIFALYYPASKISFAGEITYGDYSDGNEKRSVMFEAGYRVNDNPHIRAAYNYFYLDFQNPAPLTKEGTPDESAYWDPVDFNTHTIRLEFSKDYRHYLLFGGEGAISYSPDSDGISETAFIYVTCRFTERASLRLDARWFNQDRGIDRIGKTGRFWAENYGMVFNYRF